MKKNQSWLFQFIFEQKCVPRFILCRWRTLLSFIKEQRFIRTINLEKTYVSNIDYGYSVEEILELRNNDTSGYLLKNSIYVDFLKCVGDKQEISDAEIMETKYYQSSLNTLKTQGICRHMTRESEILNQCRYYIDLFRAIGSNTYRRDYEEFAVFQTQSRDPYPMVFRIGGSKYYMVSDGHHRLACLYVMGKRYVNVKVIGVKKKNRLRDCQKAENQSAGALKYLTGIGEMMNKIYDRIRTGIAIFKELALVEKIDLEKTYVNSLDHIEVKNVYEIIATRPEKFPDRLLKDSYDVEILQKFKDKINITDDEIKESRCYQTSCQYMCRYGTFNRVNNETDLLKYCRGFIDLYKTFDKAPYIKSPWRYISIFSRILGGNPPVVVKVADSDYCMILGGHHRLSCLYVLGKRFVNSRVEGVIKKPV